MEIFYIIPIAFALAIDAFAVSVAAGSYFGKTSSRQKFRLSFHFGLFQFAMPIAGWFAGAEIVGILADFDHWLAFGILAAIGGKMLADSFSSKTDIIDKDITRGLTLVGLAVATSIDALAVGFGMGIIQAEILFPSIIIGIVAAAMSLIGIKFGEKLSLRFGKRLQALGGIVLILIGMEIVAEHIGLF
jgi:putative Mn2+ efflux pump MntP